MDGKASWKEWGLGMKTLFQRWYVPENTSEKQPKGESIGAVFPYQFLQCPAPPPHPENKAMVPTVRFLAQIGGRRLREVRIPRKYQPAEGSWPLYILRRQHRKTWGKMDVLCSIPLILQLSVCQWPGAFSKCTPQTPSRSQMEAETQPKLPPGKESHWQGCKLCFCSVLIL